LTILSSISPKKKFGQNFLKNSETALQIVNFLELKNCKTILEIGPGMGALTKHILNIDDFQKIFIEVDSECCDYLENTFPEIEGKIINISSDAGRVGSMGETIYSGAKGGIIAFTKSLARETARNRINVNCVCPGPTNTPLLAAQPEGMQEKLTRAIPFRRIAEPEEIADAVLFFASNLSNYITGQVLSVSGGLTMAD